MNLKERANKLKSDIPAVFIALHKKEAPLKAKIVAAVAVVYALSPIDLIPDFIPVLGVLDDLIILPALVTLTIKLIPPDIFSQCQIESEDFWKNGKPKKWVYAIPFITFWAIILFLIVKAIIK